MDRVERGWLLNSLKHERKEALSKVRKAHKKAERGGKYADALYQLAYFYGRVAEAADSEIERFESAEDLPW